MNSRAHQSEELLATLACKRLNETPGVRVLIGGLGMGFTTRAALGALAADARVEVAELVPEVIAWNRGVLADLAQRPLDDPRVTVKQIDVAKLIGEANQTLHAIMLDVDNGPDAFTAPGNAALYGAPGLKRARRALVRGGIFAVWSVEEDRAFTGRLTGVGFAVEQHKVAPRAGSGARHVLWIAKAP
jgi:spermidine synthase